MGWKGTQSQVKVEAEIAVMLPQAKGCSEPPGAGRGREDPALEPSEGTWP